VLSSAAVASLAAYTVFRLTAMLPAPTRSRVLPRHRRGDRRPVGAGSTPNRDHIRGPAESLVTVVEYGDFECPTAGRRSRWVRELLQEHGEVRYVCGTCR